MHEARAATGHDLAAILGLLGAHGLPTSDISPDVGFLVVTDRQGLAGVIGLEIFGDSGLLRSLAVRADARDRGLGASLVAAIEREARHRGLQALVLLSETAAPWFARHGYRSIARADAPAAVQASDEFRTLCPASATCMIKSMESPR